MIPLPALILFTTIWIGGFFSLPFWSKNTQPLGAWIFIYGPLTLLLAGMFIGFLLGDSNMCGQPGSYCN